MKQLQRETQCKLAASMISLAQLFVDVTKASSEWIAQYLLMLLQ
jgi:hypothetical protein